MLKDMSLNLNNDQNMKNKEYLQMIIWIWANKTNLDSKICP